MAKATQTFSAATKFKLSLYAHGSIFSVHGIPSGHFLLLSLSSRSRISVSSITPDWLCQLFSGKERKKKSFILSFFHFNFCRVQVFIPREHNGVFFSFFFYYYYYYHDFFLNTIFKNTNQLEVSRSNILYYYYHLFRGSPLYNDHSSPYYDRDQEIQFFQDYYYFFFLLFIIRWNRWRSTAVS